MHNLLETSKGEVLFKGGEFDADDLFIPPYILDVTFDDVLMKDEVIFHNFYIGFNSFFLAFWSSFANCYN